MGPPRVSLHAPLAPQFSPITLSLSILCEKRETKLLPGDVLTQHLICKVVLHVPTLLPSLVVSEKAEILFSLFFFFYFSTIAPSTYTSLDFRVL